MGLSLKGIGKGLLKVAPIAASFIPGVGPLAAAGIGAAAGAIGKGKPKLSNILGGAAAGAGGALAKGAMGAGAVGGAAKSGGLGGALRSVGGFLKNNPELVMSGMGAIQGARQQGKADKLNQQALDLANRHYAETAPLRAGAMDRLTNTQRPDLSGIYAGSSNPFARPLRPLSPTMGGETPPGPMAANPMERPLREVTQPPMPSVGGRRRMY